MKYNLIYYEKTSFYEHHVYKNYNNKIKDIFNLIKTPKNGIIEYR